MCLLSALLDVRLVKFKRIPIQFTAFIPPSPPSTLLLLHSTLAISAAVVRVVCLVAQGELLTNHFPSCLAALQTQRSDWLFDPPQAGSPGYWNSAVLRSMS